MGKKPSGRANSFVSSRAGLTALAITIGAIVGLVAVGFYYLIAGWSYLVTGYSDYPAHAGAAHGFLGLSPVFIIAVPVLSALQSRACRPGSDVRRPPQRRKNPRPHRPS